MNDNCIAEFSARLKEVAKDLSFLGHPRYPLRELYQLFPQHAAFIDELEDVSVPFQVKVDEKRRAITDFLNDLARSEMEPALKKIFTQRTQDYTHLLSMMETFGSVFFYDHCTQLYGSSHKMIQNNSFLYFLERIPELCITETGEKKYKGEGALSYLRERMLETFPAGEFEVRPSTSLLSDSSAGRRVLKLNSMKAFSREELDIFLVHEGWVHLGTSINGVKQVDHPWLSTWAPRTTFLQEGLAIVVELITGRMTLERWNRVVLRHLATSMAERGSPITDVYSYLRHHELGELEAFKLALRVFRGVPLEGGMAFTKELLYLHGMVELLYHLQFFKTDLKSLWIGKISFEEHLIMRELKGPTSPHVIYFPQELESELVEARLRKLKELSFGLFNRGFL